MTQTHEDTPFEGFELSPQQAQLWRLQHTRLAPTAQLASLHIRSGQPLDAVRLKNSLLTLIERHEILRTRYQQLPGLSLPMQVIEASSTDWQALDIELHTDAHSAALRLPALHLDSTSLRYLAQEWAAAYLQAAPGEPPLQYADYAAWRLESMDDQTRQFWAEQFNAMIADVPLPWQRQTPAPSGPLEPDQIALTLDATTLQRLEQQALNLGVSPATLVLAAWVTVWQRYSEAERLTLAYDNQTRAEVLGDALGLFCEPLPLTLDTSAEQSFTALCQQVHERASVLDDARDTYPSHLSNTPVLAGVGFRELGTAPDSALNDADWHITLADSSSAACALLLQYAPCSATALTLHFDAARYTAAHIEVLAGQLLSVIEHSLREPSTSLGRMTTCNVAEQQRVTGALAQSPVLSAQQEQQYASTFALPNLAACFAQGSSANGQRPAVTGPGGTLSHAELEQRVSALTQQLLAQQLEPGARIAHFLPRDSDAVVALVAILRAGACYVPIDPSYPSERIEHILRDSQARLVLTHQARIAELPADWQSSALAMDQALPAVPLRREPSVARDQPAYLIYTSGSTGQPKGVVINHANALHSLAARLAGYPHPVQRFLLLSSFAFDSSIAGLFWSLAQGGCLHLASETEQKDPVQLARVIREQGVSHLLALPSLYALILDELGDIPSSLNTAIVAGESCPPALVASHHRRQPQAQLYNEYGPTEASVWSTVALCQADQNPGYVPIGRAIAHTRVYVLNSEGAPVSRGLKGELHIAGPGLSQGYLGLAQMSAEKFVAACHPSLDGQRLYRTGDFVSQDIDGQLLFLGRTDSQIKLRGYRIELGEIESALCKVSGATLASVLLDTSQAEPSLRAFIESAEPPQASAVRESLATLLPAHMVPADIQWLAQLPRTANGKIDHRALLARAPSRSLAAYEAPEGHVEHVLVAVWQELLDAQVIGRHDDFFALGGHSLLVVRMTARLRAILGVEVPVNVIFQHPTLIALAGQISRPHDRTAVITLQAGEPGQTPLFCLHQPSGTVHHYMPMVAGLPKAMPVFGIPLPDTLRDQDIEALAREYVPQIRQIQAQGPYRLGGWSMGGLLALELARQLEAQGQAVEWLGLFDSTLHAEDESLDWEALYALVEQELSSDSRSRLTAPSLAQLRKATAGFGRVEQLRFALLQWVDANGLELSAPRAYVEQTLNVMADARRWVSAYSVPAVNTVLHLWWAEQTIIERPSLPVQWDAASQRTRHYHVAGDHDTILGQTAFHEQLSKSLASPSTETLA
ncbi:amino acid adenylation domain-containing protein [Pseudomonas sp. SH10-3B]|uniref:non-ribosomal peptide synthetase n=1 Tax=Pseudomonas sp. SH10-3B TaxID=2816049 RepID=UPI001CA6BB85|nr:non-ribosomal peptide synthetase [Pseudomonas sp. SH10-3B]MBY8947247.1 amino acid adenylation domain-containing protein [Pseudomonas sp. SH10-3B]